MTTNVTKDIDGAAGHATPAVVGTGQASAGGSKDTIASVATGSAGNGTPSVSTEQVASDTIGPKDSASYAGSHISSSSGRRIAAIEAVSDLQMKVADDELSAALEAHRRNAHLEQQLLEKFAKQKRGLAEKRTRDLLALEDVQSRQDVALRMTDKFVAKSDADGPTQKRRSSSPARPVSEPGKFRFDSPGLEIVPRGDTPTSTPQALVRRTTRASHPREGSYTPTRSDRSPSNRSNPLSFVSPRGGTRTVSGVEAEAGFIDLNRIAVKLAEAESQRVHEESAAGRRDLVQTIQKQVGSLHEIHSRAQELEHRLQVSQSRAIKLRQENASAEQRIDAANLCVAELRNQLVEANAKGEVFRQTSETAVALISLQGQTALQEEQKALVDAARTHVNTLEERNQRMLDDAHRLILSYQEEIDSTQESLKQAQDERTRAMHIAEATYQQGQQAIAVNENLRASEEAARVALAQSEEQCNKASQAALAAQNQAQSIQEQAAHIRASAVEALRQAEAEKQQAINKIQQTEVQNQALQVQLRDATEALVSAQQQLSRSVAARSESGLSVNSQALLAQVQDLQARNYAMVQASREQWTENERLRRINEHMSASQSQHSGVAGALSSRPPRPEQYHMSPRGSHEDVQPGTETGQEKQRDTWYEGEVASALRRDASAHSERCTSNASAAGRDNAKRDEDMESIKSQLDELQQAIRGKETPTRSEAKKETAQPVSRAMAGPPSRRLTTTMTEPSAVITLTGNQTTPQEGGPPRYSGGGNTARDRGGGGGPGGPGGDDDGGSDGGDDGDNRNGGGPPPHTPPPPPPYASGPPNPNDHGDPRNLAGSHVVGTGGDGRTYLRKEADSFTFPKLNNAATFRDAWADSRREVMNKSAAGVRAVALWWRSIQQVHEVTWEQLAHVTPEFEGTCGKVLSACLKATDGQLLRDIRREEKVAFDKASSPMTGRQAMRMVYMHFETNLVASQLFTINHVQDMKFPGDKLMGAFLSNWHTILNNLQPPGLTDDQLRVVFFEKIKDSQRIRAWLDRYNMAEEADPEHSYQYLLRACEMAVAKDQAQHNTTLDAAAVGAGAGIGVGPGKGKKALAAQHSKQCPFWLKPTGCRDPSNCNLGSHDPEFQGKGKGKSKGAKDDHQGNANPGKGDTKGDPKGKGKGRGKGKGAHGDATTSPPGQADRPKAEDTKFDGVPPCMKCMKDRKDKTSTCAKTAPSVYHGRKGFSRAMWQIYDKYQKAKSENQEKQKAAAAKAKEDAASGNDAPAAGADPNAAAAPKAKPKAKP